MEDKIDAKFNVNLDKIALSKKRLYKKIRLLFIRFNNMKVKMDMQQNIMISTCVSEGLASQGGSKGSMGMQTLVLQSCQRKKKVTTQSQTKTTYNS